MYSVPPGLLLHCCAAFGHGSEPVLLQGSSIIPVMDCLSVSEDQRFVDTVREADNLASSNRSEIG